MITVQEINDPQRLANYRLLWSSLLSQTPGATFFQSLDWLLTYWTHHGHDERLRMLLVLHDNQPLGILPLVIAKERTRLGTMRTLTYPLKDWGAFYGPIGANPAATLYAGLAHIRGTRRDWDQIDLRWVHASGPDRGRTEHAMHAADLSPQVRPWEQVPLISLEGAWDDYRALRSRRWRKIRHCERQVAEAGEISYIRCRPPGAALGDSDPAWQWYDACEQIAAKSWQATSPDGTTLSHAEVRAFLRDMHQAAAHCGSADINLLLVAGQPVAFIYGYVYRGSLFTLRGGFDATATRDGAGAVLLAKMIEDSFARGDHTINLGSGSLHYKQFWQTSLETSVRCTHFPPFAPRSQAVRLKRAVQQWLGSSTAAVPEALEESAC